MTIYVDESIHKFRGSDYCHMFSDLDDPAGRKELDDMARLIGLSDHYVQAKRPGFTHYDLSPNMRRRAVAYGAKFMPGKEMIKTIVWPRRERLKVKHG